MRSFRSFFFNYSPCARYVLIENLRPWNLRFFLTEWFRSHLVEIYRRIGIFFSSTRIQIQHSEKSISHEKIFAETRRLSQHNLLQLVKCIDKLLNKSEFFGCQQCDELCGSNVILWNTKLLDVTNRQALGCNVISIIALSCCLCRHFMLTMSISKKLCFVVGFML